VLLRDCVLAATVVAVMAGFALFGVTALNATVFADEIRAYASDAAPSIVAYNEKVAGRLDDPPPLPAAGESRRTLSPRSCGSGPLHGQLSLADLAGGDRRRIGGSDSRAVRSPGWPETWTG
jgi:hypothetical protein